MDLPRSIKDATAAVKDMREAVDQLRGVVMDGILDDITNGIDEIDRYLLDDAEEARIRIDDLESELEEAQSQLASAESS